ncbi:MAG TPA: hypothetical protein VF755_04375 [Catenuloplanes sp.]|jgi:hypothetical protein
MPSYDDRGLVTLTDNPDGTTTVAVCAAVDRGRPINVYARYSAVEKVHIDSAVHLKDSATGRYTDAIVHVVGAADGVHVRPVRSVLPG